MRRTRWTTALVAGLVIAACGGDGGPSGPGPDVRSFTIAHTFRIADEGGTEFTVQCPGSARLTVTQAGAVSGTVTIDPCPALQLQEPLEIPLQTGTVQNGQVTFRIAGQQALLESVQEQFQCETEDAGAAFTGTLTETVLDANVQATFECDGEQVQGTLTVTWRIQGPPPA